MTKLYVASSWRNTYYEKVLATLRQAGHECYDFKNPKPGESGFAWSSIDGRWHQWTLDEYTNGLLHPIAQAGYNNDKEALDWCEQCVLVLPSGRSAHTEAGYAAGQGKKVHVYIDKTDPKAFEPELMYLIYTTICGNLDGLLYALHKHRLRAPQFKEEEMIGVTHDHQHMGVDLAKGPDESASYIENAADMLQKEIINYRRRD